MEAKDIIYKVEAVEIATGRVVVFDNADCEYSYRQSKFKHEWKDKYLVTHVIYRLQKPSVRIWIMVISVLRSRLSVLLSLQPSNFVMPS